MLIHKKVNVDLNSVIHKKVTILDLDSVVHKKVTIRSRVLFIKRSAIRSE